LVSVPVSFHLSPEEEKSRYDQHQNDPADPAYQKFLSRTFEPLLAKISKDSEGLDFGCGSGPTISEMGKKQGVSISNYDLYYFNESELLERQYDFITLTEVIEHIANPQLLMQQLDSLLKTEGILAIMTKRVMDRQAFQNWHYKNDSTHICFYSLETFEWIAEFFDWRLEVIDKDVVFFYS